MRDKRASGGFGLATALALSAALGLAGGWLG